MFGVVCKATLEGRVCTNVQLIPVSQATRCSRVSLMEACQQTRVLLVFADSACFCLCRSNGRTAGAGSSPSLQSSQRWSRARIRANGRLADSAAAADGHLVDSVVVADVADGRLADSAAVVDEDAHLASKATTVSAVIEEEEALRNETSIRRSITDRGL